MKYQAENFNRDPKMNVGYAAAFKSADGALSFFARFSSDKKLWSLTLKRNLYGDPTLVEIRDRLIEQFGTPSQSDIDVTLKQLRMQYDQVDEVGALTASLKIVAFSKEARLPVYRNGKKSFQKGGKVTFKLLDAAGQADYYAKINKFDTPDGKPRPG